MAAQLKDFWTCGIFLSKEPFEELAIKCFMCDSLYFTIDEFQKHLAQIHADAEDEEGTFEKPASSRKCQLNNHVFLGLCEVENSELVAETINNINNCEQVEDDELLYEIYSAEKLEYPITETIVKSVEKTTAVSLKTRQQCNSIRLFKNRALETKQEERLKKEKSFMCDKCGLLFREHVGLWHHLRIAHYKLRPFQCDKCPKTYARKTHLSDHMRSHSQRRDFVCNLCDMAFRRSQELTRHKRRHLATKDYRCLRCDAKFRQHSGLYHHVKIKHGANNVKL